jgi:hypothetical protein
LEIDPERDQGRAWIVGPVEKRTERNCDIHGVAGLVRVVEYELAVVCVCTWDGIIL